MIKKSITHTHTHTHTISSRRKAERECCNSNTLKYNNQEFSETDKGSDATDSRNTTNPKQNKYKENHYKHIIIKLLKNKNKKQNNKKKKKKNLPANAGDTGSSPGLGRSNMARSN